MNLKLLPCPVTDYPVQALLVKGSSPADWLADFRFMGLDLKKVQVYAVPSATANVLYGCVVLFESSDAMPEPGRAGYCCLVKNKLIIPQHTRPEPQLAEAEWQKLFSDNYYFFHPETGLAELEEEVDWGSMIVLPEQKSEQIITPLTGVAIPKRITSIFFDIEAEAFANSIDKPFGDEEIDKLPFDMKKVIKGNQREIDKYLKFLEQNPELALKYAIPLDILGTTRGGGEGKFRFGRGTAAEAGRLAKYVLFGILGIMALIFLGSIIAGTGTSFSGGYVLLAIVLFRLLRSAFSSGNSSSGGYGGSAVIGDDRFNTLRQKYEKLAQDYIKQKEHKKAAHIYARLLQNDYRAAEVLEEGGYNGEAAPIYLKRCQNKLKAAECYEKGHIYHEALALYKEMNNHEKTGDMYVLLNKKQDADKYYDMLAGIYREKSQFVKASLVYKNKIKAPEMAANILLEGWRTNKDAYNCLNKYFSNMALPEDVIKGIRAIHKGLTPKQRENFLKAIQLEYRKHDLIKDDIKDIAYEVIAEELPKNPAIASELINYNKDDKTIVKDVMKYKAMIKGR